MIVLDNIQHKDAVMRERSTVEAATRKPPNRQPVSHRVDADTCSSPHEIEECVQRELLAAPELKFSSLVVRRIRNGVCLEGVLEADEGGPDVCSLARRVSGVETVLNHLVIQRSRQFPPPLKG